jgi:hypothetical protein
VISVTIRRGPAFIVGNLEHISEQLGLDRHALQVLMRFGAPVHELKNGLYFTHIDKLNEFVAKELADFAARAQM